MPSTFQLTTVVTFLSYPLIFIGYHLVASSLPGKSGYAVLSSDEQAEWRSRVMSSVAATLMAVLAFPGVIDGFFDCDAQCRTSDNSHLTTVACGVMIGYLSFDIGVVLFYRMAPMGQTLAHHVMAVVMFSVVAVGGGPNFVTCWHLMGEASTPLVNMRWFLSKTPGYGSGGPMMATGLSMLVVFSLVRVAHLPWTLPLLWNDFAVMEEKFSRPSLRIGYRALWLVAEFFITCMNGFWLSLMVKGALKVLNKKPSKAS